MGVSIGQQVTRRIKKIGYFSSNRNWENYRDIFLVLLQKELKVRYNNKALGYIWSIANPLANAIVYFIAFKLFMRISVEDYPLVLLSGVFPWQWLSNAVGSAPNIFVGNASIIKKVSFPRNILLLCMVANHMIHYVISIPVILLFLLFYHRFPTYAWLYGIPILLVSHFFLAYGISLILASLNLFFRDLERLTGIVLNFVFYLTPILYPLEVIPHRVQKLAIYNPATPIIISWRELFLYGRMDWHYTLISLAYAVLFFAIGTVIYRRLSWKFAEVI